MLRFHTNFLGNNKGFTLIEVLIVLAIVGVLMSVATISLNALLTSPVQEFKDKFNISFANVEKFTQHYNKASTISFNTKQKKVQFYYFDSTTDKWLINTHIPELLFNDLEILSDVQTIVIRPNGFVSGANITISQNKEDLPLMLEIKASSIF
jgi:prepilin-type N-terminal cleavage/methylation domain-containing protein